MSGILSLLSAESGRVNPVSITDHSVFKHAIDPNDAFASYIIYNNRTIKNQNGVLLDTWLDAAYNPSDFEVMATVLSGVTPIGTVGSWFALTSGGGWSLSQTAPGEKDCTLLIQIGYVGIHSALDTATITITATVDA
jgi:hypothetical protein